MRPNRLSLRAELNGMYDRVGKCSSRLLLSVVFGHSAVLRLTARGVLYEHPSSRLLVQRIVGGVGMNSSNHHPAGR